MSRISSGDFTQYQVKSLRLGRQLARNVGKDDEDCVRHLRQRLAVLLVRDNVALLCARTPTFPDPEVDGEAEGLL